MSTALVVIQARMGSTRLPGKVLADLGGRPLLGVLLDRIDGRVDAEVVVATSEGAADDAVADLAERRKVAVVRGSEHDVLARFALALHEHPAGTVVRLTADCPFTDPEIVERALEVHRTTGADYTSNTLVRTYPDGLDVEVIAAPALLAAHAEAPPGPEREHVTPFVYRRPERFHLEAFRNDVDLGDERWTVDTEDDLAFVRSLVTQLGGATFPWRDALPFTTTRRHPVATLRLTPAADSTPGARRWELTGRGASGRVGVDVTAGRAIAYLDVPAPLEEDALRLLRERLTADAQVVELVRD